MKHPNVALISIEEAGAVVKSIIHFEAVHKVVGT
jgi:hypothetical protein